MALPFTDAQRDAIRLRLFESAQKHLRTSGAKKTSLDMLTADAGISKSSFYRFFETKEQLFFEVAGCWENEILSGATKSLAQSTGMSNKARAAAFVYAAFEMIVRLELVRFMREDLPYLNSLVPQNEAKVHCMNSSQMIFDSLREAKIQFHAPDETVLSVIQLLYLSILSSVEIGEGFFPALRELVQSACDRLVA